MKRICSNKNTINYSHFQEECPVQLFLEVGGNTTVEVLTRDLGTKQLPNLPDEIEGSSVVMHNGIMLLCGGFYNFQKCLQLDQEIWKEHSTLNTIRVNHSAVTTQTATFLFGGDDSRTTYEYLPKNSITWLKGKTEIPGGFEKGCAIAVKSDKEIWLIGGLGTGKRILSFIVKDHTFQVLPSQLEVERVGLKCAFIPNTNKVMMIGGVKEDFSNHSSGLAEILDTDDESITRVNSMNSRRAYHGIGDVTINDEKRLAVFGGCNGRFELDSVEFYNNQLEVWETSNMKLKQPKSHFAFINVKLGDIIVPNSNSASYQQTASQVTENAGLRFISRTFHIDSFSESFQSSNNPLQRPVNSIVQETMESSSSDNVQLPNSFMNGVAISMPISTQWAALEPKLTTKNLDYL